MPQLGSLSALSNAQHSLSAWSHRPTSWSPMIAAPDYSAFSPSPRPPALRLCVAEMIGWSGQEQDLYVCTCVLAEPLRVAESNLLFHWEFHRTGSDSAEIQFLGEGGKTFLRSSLFHGTPTRPHHPFKQLMTQGSCPPPEWRRRVETAAWEVGEKIWNQSLTLKYRVLRFLGGNKTKLLISCFANSVSTGLDVDWKHAETCKDHKEV